VVEKTTDDSGKTPEKPHHPASAAGPSASAPAGSRDFDRHLRYFELSLSLAAVRN
jgi:hypothetical protein